MAAEQGRSADSAPVVFVAQWEATFDLVAPVVQALRTRGVPTLVAVTPEPDGDSFAEADALVLWERLRAGGHHVLPLVPADQEADRLRGLRPSAVFLPSPYENQRHRDLAPERLDLPVHFVNYCLRINPDIPVLGSPTRHDFYDQCEAVYLENDHEESLFLESGMDPRKVVVTGHPGLDVWDAPHELAPRPTVLWCPWWAHRLTDGSRGYSTFAEGHAVMLEEVRRRPGVEFWFRPHPIMLSRMLHEGRWDEDDQRRFLAELDSLPNISYTDADRVGHVEQLARAWAMVTDGLTFYPEFAYTGKPLLLTQAPGNPGWSPVGQALEPVVETSHFMDRLPEFLDRVERGVDPAEVAERRLRVGAILGRRERPAAELVADHVESCRDARRVAATRRGALPSAPSALGEELVTSIRALNGDDPAGPRPYQRALLVSGLLELAGGSVPATSAPVPHAAGRMHVIATGVRACDPVLVTGPVGEGWPIERVVLGDWAYAATGERLGPAAEVLGGHVARRAEWSRDLPWAYRRQVRLGTGWVWSDLVNQLPALVVWEDELAALVADDRVRVGFEASARGQLEALGETAGLLPGLAGALGRPSRRTGGPGSVPVGSTRATALARQRVRAALADMPVPPKAGPRLWLGVVPGDGDAPENALAALAEVGAAWCSATGGDVAVDAFVPDAEQRAQWWREDDIAAADAARARVAAAIGAAGGGAVLTTSGIDLRECLAWAGTADFYLCAPGPLLQRLTWVWDAPGLALLGPWQHRASVVEWFSHQVDGGIRCEAVDVDLVAGTGPLPVTRESPYRVPEPRALAEHVLARAAAQGVRQA